LCRSISIAADQENLKRPNSERNISESSGVGVISSAPGNFLLLNPSNGNAHNDLKHFCDEHLQYAEICRLANL